MKEIRCDICNAKIGTIIREVEMSEKKRIDLGDTSHVFDDVCVKCYGALCDLVDKLKKG